MTAPTDTGGRAVAPARACAYRVLRRVFEQGAYAEKALMAEAGELDPRDRALAMRLSYGAVQRRATSDHLIEGLAGRPAAELDPPVLAALRLGLYELLYLGGAPDYAVIDDAVELAKVPRRKGHGLVNAVLRRAAREGRERLLGALGEQTAAAASVKHSHPLWIAELWWEALGPQVARELMARDNEPAELALRANTLRGDATQLAQALEVPSHRDPVIAEALVLDGPLDIHASPLWAEGAYTAQSRAAMLVSIVLGPEPGERLLDLCAAPGGKSTHLAAIMRAEGEIVAVERNARRAHKLERTAQRMGAANIRVEVADAERSREDGPFDRVLVDPPCSGLGTLQARPDRRWRASSESIETMRQSQSRILVAGADALRPGGMLVYSTCTVSPTENERLIFEFLESRTDFALEDLAAEWPAYAQVLPGSSQTTGALLTLPHRDDTAGFFIARMRRS